MACLLQCSWSYCSSSSSQPSTQHNLQYTWENPVPYQHEATHQTYAVGYFIRTVTVACDNRRLPLVFTRPTHHTYTTDCLWSGQNTDPVPSYHKKWGVASVKSLTWQHLHWTAEVGRGHNRYERQRQSTQSMVTVGLWRSHTGYLGWGRAIIDHATPHCTTQHSQMTSNIKFNTAGPSTYISVRSMYVHTFP